MQALILNIETATATCSVCIAQGTQILSIQESSDAYSHASAITLLIEACAKAARVELSALDAVAISSGPGSYTALRVGASVAKGICYALNKPMIAVDTLEALATAARATHPNQGFYIPMIDARRMEVYTSVFDQDLKQLALTHNLILDQQSFAEYFQTEKTLVFCGDGAPKSQVLFETKPTIYSNVRCSSRHLVPLSYQAFQQESFVDIAYYAPVYFKAPNITVSKKTL